ncbi:hypothetical protein DPMN_100098 [Dreissena polymorpha]|uniref:Secreted protein n=1 Tax=Dreissena polymorpha TaxID=45954 RepID=A0A9D4R722_DREPO|nr:hypothetical protein DPMN_100098 [Dreissena polymorpha]
MASTISKLLDLLTLASLSLALSFPKATVTMKEFLTTRLFLTASRSFSCVYIQIGIFIPANNDTKNVSKITSASINYGYRNRNVIPSFACL